MPSNWPQWVAPILRRDTNEAKRLFDEVLTQFSPGKLVMSVTGAAQSRNNDQWVEAMVAALNDAGCPIHIVDANSISDEVHCFNISGFLPSVSSPSNLFALFQENSGWVPKLDVHDDIYNDLINQVRTNPSLISDLNERFINMAYAIPLFEEPVSWYWDESKIISMNDDGQDISLMPHLIVPRKT